MDQHHDCCYRKNGSIAVELVRNWILHSPLRQYDTSSSRGPLTSQVQQRGQEVFTRWGLSPHNTLGNISDVRRRRKQPTSNLSKNPGSLLFHSSRRSAWWKEPRIRISRKYRRWLGLFQRTVRTKTAIPRLCLSKYLKLALELIATERLFESALQTVHYIKWCLLSYFVLPSPLHLFCFGRLLCRTSNVRLYERGVVQIPYGQRCLRYGTCLLLLCTEPYARQAPAAAKAVFSEGPLYYIGMDISGSLSKTKQGTQLVVVLTTATLDALRRYWLPKQTPPQLLASFSSTG